MNVKAITRHTYAGIERHPGDEYDMEERFVDAMSRMGHVIRIDEVNSSLFQTRDLEAEPPKKQYKRRDLQAK